MYAGRGGSPWRSISSRTGHGASIATTRVPSFPSPTTWARAAPPARSTRAPTRQRRPGRTLPSPPPSPTGRSRNNSPPPPPSTPPPRRRPRTPPPPFAPPPPPPPPAAPAGPGANPRAPCRPPPAPPPTPPRQPGNPGTPPPPPRATQPQQPRSIPRLRGRLRNQPGRQLVMEGGSDGASRPPLSRG